MNLSRGTGRPGLNAVSLLSAAKKDTSEITRSAAETSASRLTASFPTFEVQQKLFPPQAAGVAAELAVFVDDAVAGDHDRNPIETVRPADGSRGSRHVDGAGLLLV